MIAGIRDAGRTVLRRWRRSLLTIGASAIGTATAIAMLGVAQGNAELIVSRFDQFEATAISVQLPAESWTAPEQDLLGQLDKLPWIESAGTLSLPQPGSAGVQLTNPNSSERADVAIAVATEQGLRAAGLTFRSGGQVSEQILQKDPAVVFLGQAVADQLGVNAVAGTNRVLVGGSTATVVGVIANSSDTAAVTSALMVVSPTTAIHFDVLPGTRTVSINLTPGSAEAAAPLLPLALYPLAPDEVSVSIPPSPDVLRRELTDNALSLVVTVTAVTAAATLFGIVTTMQISVWERRREIGLARAIGMTKRSVALGFFWESILLAIFGAVAGSLLGVLVVAAVAALNGTPLILSPLAALIPLLGTAAGGLAGLIPAHTASSIDPLDLLRT